MTGWIRIDRRLLDHWLWKDKPFSKGQAWVDILMRASHKNNKFLLGNRLMDVVPGQFVTSEKKLMEAWGWGKGKTRTFLSLLETEQMIVKKTNHKQTTITVVNWGIYQNHQTSECTTDRPLTNHNQTDSRLIMDHERTDSGPLSDTINNDNNDNNDNNVVVVDAAPTPIDEQISQIVEAWNQIPHTVKIKNIIPMTSRWDELRVVLGMVGFQGVMDAIQRVKESSWLSQRGHVVFDRYINRNAIQGLLEGAYDVDYRKKEVPESDGYAFGL